MNIYPAGLVVFINQIGSYGCAASDCDCIKGTLHDNAAMYIHYLVYMFVVLLIAIDFFLRQKHGTIQERSSEV